MLTFLIPTAKEMAAPEQTYPHHVSVKTQTLITHLSQKSPEELAELYRIKPAAALLEFERWQTAQKGKAAAYPAIALFNGLMYRQIKTDFTAKQEKLSRVYITSALYGVIPAEQPIVPHRLDFNFKLEIEGSSLKNYWRGEYDHFAQKQDTIISLLSAEFAAVFSPEQRKQFISLEFVEEKDGHLKKHSTISKKARGQLLTQALKENCQTVEELKGLNFFGFSYCPHLSTNKQLVFIKTAAASNIQKTT
ncbi:peroxide stress protein YaaA [Streptococcus pantholopis]|uniref:peroxide stress protein YaaA n=1 Tax=Streptococcus pantholopis TaxID=1811193 RepID=UPI000AA7894D|nr:peroxide stress protein YaaA [Streptococcus pantholopis]